MRPPSKASSLGVVQKTLTQGWQSGTLYNPDLLKYYEALFGKRNNKGAGHDEYLEYYETIPSIGQKLSCEN